MLAESVFWDLTGPQVGTFDCRSENRIEGYPAPGFTLTGKFFSSKGAGAYEDKHMKGTFANIPGTLTFRLRA